LVAGTHREVHSRKTKAGNSVTVKASDISAHFSHHSNNKLLIADCELRSQSITPTQKKAFQAQARGQIAKIFRQKFFRMLKTSIKLPDVEAVNPVLVGLWQIASVKQNRAAESQLNTLIQLLAERFAQTRQIEKTKDSLQPSIEKWIKLLKDDPQSIPASYREQFEQWSNVLDQRMQVLIVGQAIEYLVQKAQIPVLDQLVRCALYSWILAQASHEYYRLDRLQSSERSALFDRLSARAEETDEEGFNRAMVLVCRSLIGMNENAFDVIFSFVREDILQMLVFVDWADQFEKSEI
jgi:hypothetical protein